MGSEVGLVNIDDRKPIFFDYEMDTFEFRFGMFRVLKAQRYCSQIHRLQSQCTIAVNFIELNRTQSVIDILTFKM